ncbi:MAG: ATP-binding protein [Bacteroidales bacterium]|nr:ATP-binding protein [Bacteroidales bacterium]
MEINDMGIGMPSDVLNNLFNPNVNITKVGTKNEKGSGLALILCKEFVEKHGGNIWTESEPDKRSTFLLQFLLVYQKIS